MSVSEKIGIEKVSISVLEKIWYRKSIRFCIKKNWYQKSIDIGFGKNWYRKSIGICIGKYLLSKKVSDSVSKKLVLEKVLDSVWFIFWVPSHTGGGEGRFPETFFVTPALNCNCGFSELVMIGERSILRTRSVLELPRINLS